MLKIVSQRRPYESIIKVISLFAVLGLLLIGYGFTESDSELKGLQKWLKGLGPNYSLKELKNIEELDLSSNQLRTLPKSFRQLKSLKVLDLRENSLSDKEKKRIKKLLPNCDIQF